MILAAFPLTAHADEPAPEAPPSEPIPAAQPSAPVVAAAAGDVSVGRLGPVLDAYADEDRTSRLVRGIAGLTLAAAEVPVGIYMSSKEEKGPGYFVIAFGAGSALGGTFAFFEESPMARIASSYRLGLAQGRPPAEVVAETEKQWAESARRERLLRQAFGLTFGAAPLAGGGGLATLGASF